MNPEKIQSDYEKHCDLCKYGYKTDGAICEKVPSAIPSVGTASVNVVATQNCTFTQVKPFRAFIVKHGLKIAIGVCCLSIGISIEGLFEAV